jgi:multidrug resistance efflux pump
MEPLSRTQMYLVHICFLGLLLMTGCNSQSQPTVVPGATAVASSDTSVQIGNGIKALGTIRPAQILQLGFGAGAPVRSMSARLGKEVRAGDVLAELDTGALALELESAEQEVVVSQAALDRLLSGPNAMDIERAEADHALQVADAEAALQMARQRLAQAQCQDHTSDVAIARAGVEQSQVQRTQARANSPSADVAVARVNVEQAQDALAAARDEYRKALDRPWEPQEIRDALSKAVQRAEWEAKAAQARLEGAQRAEQAHALGLEALALAGDMAEARLVQALDAQAAYSETLAFLAAEVTLAELHLDKLNAWTNPLLDPPAAEEVTQAQARLRQAELAVEQLHWQIDRAVLRAPFDGTISAVYLHPGEWAAAGVPILEIVDTGRWYVETRNVGELAIGRVHVGQQAIVEVLALDKAELKGTVATISPIAVVQQGDTTYTLSIDLEPTDLNLRPGMNVQVEIRAN